VGDVVRAGESGSRLGEAASELFAACVPAIPYVSATLFLGRERGKLQPRENEPVRVAVVADGVGAVHGVTRTLDELRERGLAGFDVEVIGTDARVDRRLSAVAEVRVPFYPDLELGVPSLPAATEALTDGGYDVVHVVAPGPAGVTLAVLAGMAEIPVVGSYHTELAAYAGLRSGDARLEAAMYGALGAFYGACRLVLSPSPAADASLRRLGLPEDRLARWGRGVDVTRFDPRRRVEGRLPGEVSVLYAGRLTREKGVELLAEAFLAARARDPRLHLVLAGGGPEEAALRERLGEHATFLGWLEGDELARAYASADLFLFASRTDTFGQVILEAQASGLPVVAVAEGGPLALIRDGVSGRLCPPEPEALGAAVAELASARRLCGRLALGGLAEVRARTWERSLAQLADGYRRVLGAGGEAERRRAA
jgi:glycosyltransferase involved in cell wall biosynthesis